MQYICRRHVFPVRERGMCCVLSKLKTMEMQRMNRKLRDKLILVATCLGVVHPVFWTGAEGFYLRHSH